MAQRHGNEVLEIIKRLDDAEKAAREWVKEGKAAARRRDTEACQAVRKEQKDRQRKENGREPTSHGHLLNTAGQFATERERDEGQSILQVVPEEVQAKFRSWASAALYSVL